MPYVPKAGPLTGLVVPALGHLLVDGLGRVLRAVQQVPLLQVLHHLWNNTLL